MKIAVSSESPGLDSMVDPRFGRAKCFIFYDTESGQLEVCDNRQVLDLPQGAGIQAARTVIDHDAEVLITGHCGPNAFRTLQAGGVKVVVGAQGKVKEAIEKFQQGVLKASESADVEGHW